MSRRTQIGAAQDGGVFKDWLKQSYGLRGAAGFDFPAYMNADQYPTVGASLPGTIFRSVPVPAYGVTTSTPMVLRWAGTMDGDGGTFLGAFLNLVGGFVATATAGSILNTGSNLYAWGTNGRVEFTFGTVPDSFEFRFLIGGATGVFSLTKVMICRASDETDAWANASPESIIADEYIAEYVNLGINTFRPMGWAGTNSGMVSQHRYGHNWDTGIGYGCGIWQPGAWVGTIAGTNTYTCSPGTDYPSGPYVHGEVIQGRVTNTSTAPCTLNVTRSGSSGAKPIVDTRGQRMSATDPFVESPLPGGILNTFVYDRIIDSWVAHATDNFTDGQGAGIDCLSGPPWPLAVRVGLCNACDMNYWHNFDLHLDDTSVTQQVTYMRDNLNEGKTCILEYSNEIWNFGFAQFHMCTEMGRALGFAEGDGAGNGPRRYGWQGLRQKQMYDLAIAAWSPRDPSELRFYCGMRIDFSDPTSEFTRFALEGENLTSSGNASYAALIGVDYDTAPDRPVDLYTDIGAAPYWGGTMVQQLSGHYLNSTIAGGFPPTILLDMADDYDSGNATLMDEALQWVDRDCRGIEPGGWPIWLDFTLYGYTAGILQGNPIDPPGLGYPGMKALADSFGLTARAYEGGWSLEAPAVSIAGVIGIDASYCGPGGKIDNLINGWRNSSYAYETCLDYMTEYETAGWVEPSWLMLNGGATGNPFAVWHADPLSGATPQKAWDAIHDINLSSLKGFNTRLR